MNDSSADISSVAYVGGMLAYLGQSARARLRLIVLGTLLTMLIVFLLDRTETPVYLAEATIRLGRIDGEDVLPMPATAVLMNSMPFRRRVADAVASDKGGGPGFNGFSVRPETPELASVSVSGSSGQRATEALQLIVRTLNADQEKLRVPALSELNGQLELVDTNIASLMKVRETLASTEAATPSAPGDPVALALRRVWLLELVTRNEERLAAVVNERRALVARIGPGKSYPATLSDDVTVRQISPRPARSAVFAGALALLVLLLYAMMVKPTPARAG
jgi:hypothetical protein